MVTEFDNKVWRRRQRHATASGCETALFVTKRSFDDESVLLVLSVLLMLSVLSVPLRRDC